MNTKKYLSLEEVLLQMKNPQLPEVTMKIELKGGVTNIYIDNITNSRAISTKDSRVNYDANKFQENPSKYLQEQVVEHYKYKTFLEETLRNSQSDFNKLIDVTNDIERPIDYMSHNEGQLVHAIFNTINTVVAWAHFESAEKYWITRQDENIEIISIGHGILENIIVEGKEFISSIGIKNISENDKYSINTINTLQDDLNYINSRIKDIEIKHQNKFKQTYLKHK